MRTVAADERRSLRGWGLTEALVGLALVGVVASAAAPSWVGWRDRRRLLGAGWTVATMFDAARLRALRDGRARALVFTVGETREGGSWLLARDDDGDGIRRSDLEDGRDRVEAGPFTWRARFPGVRPGTGSATAGPGGSSLPADGIAIGGNLVTASPGGTTSSGTLYLEGAGSRVVAVRWYGPTGRFSSWLLEPGGDGWERLR